MSEALSTISPMDRWLALARELVGKELDRTLRRKNLEATPSLVRRYAYGIGDDNPLWCDGQYAARSRYGRIVAPPTYIFSVDDTVVRDPELHDMRLLFGGNDIEFFRPILTGMTMTSRAVVTEVREVQSRRAGRLAIMMIDFTYHDASSGELIARALTPMMRVPEASTSEGLRYEPRPVYEYSEAERAEIAQAVAAETRRGSVPRFWEEVEVGERPTPVVKGPLTLMDMVCYYAGNGVPQEIYRAHELVYRQGSFVDPMKHIDPSLASQVGMPGAFDIGHQRVGWVAQMLTNWMGDDGTLVRLNTRVTRPNVFGDTTWCHSEVTGRRLEAGAHLVDLSVWTENQHDERTTEGTATVALPSRELLTSA